MQAYVDMFSKSLSSEYGPLGISVQNQAPMHVTTKMSKLRNATLTVPTPKAWVAQAVKHIGYEATSSPYWWVSSRAKMEGQAWVLHVSLGKEGQCYFV